MAHVRLFFIYTVVVVTFDMWQFDVFAPPDLQVYTLEFPGDERVEL